MLALRLKTAFDHRFQAPLEAWQVFASMCQVVHVKKNEIIKQYNQVEKYGYFILTGSCGVFIWKENNYVCLDLMYEESFFGDYMSLITKEPSPFRNNGIRKYGDA